MSSFGATDPYDEATVRAMVAAVAPDWEVTSIEPCRQGTDAIYFVAGETPTGERDAVLKACEFTDAARFRREPRLLDRAADAGLPVPSVYGIVDEHVELPAPYFLMERCRGESLPDGGADELSADALATVAATAGRALATTHDLVELDGFGVLGGSGGELTVAEPGRDWRSVRQESIEGDLDELEGGRFDDLHGELREYFEAEIELLDRQFDPALAHNDYRVGNLLLDLETGETHAILDWGAVFAAHAEYDLVSTEQHLAGHTLPSDERRHLVREHLYTGYERVNPLARDAELRRRRRFYLLDTQLSAMRWLPHWHADATAKERAAVAEHHRAFVRELL
jgi:aminoglycoside phosphotransferase (APT) family kinase protein